MLDIKGSENLGPRQGHHAVILLKSLQAMHLGVVEHTSFQDIMEGAVRFVKHVL